MMTAEQRDQRRKDLEAEYARVYIPDLVREDIEASSFYHRTTVERSGDNRVDPYALVRNEGARMAWVAFFDRVQRAKRREESQTKAVSDTVEAA
jgi:hypothetical protein